MSHLLLVEDDDVDVMIFQRALRELKSVDYPHFLEIVRIIHTYWTLSESAA